MMRLSVVLNFYNMRREAPRTLFSVSSEVQGIPADQYEIIAVDHGSSEPLDHRQIEELGPNISYRYIDTGNSSPCEAINSEVAAAKGEFVICCIDGARILSPGILSSSLHAASLYEKPFVYTLSMHLGPDVQNISIEQGYDRAREDALLESVNWRKNGYELFSISSVASSSGAGFYSRLAETNCFLMNRKDYLDLGGYDPNFQSAGGGLANHDLFIRVHQDVSFTPVMLMGEATFHQIHGGVATNARVSDHPFPRMNAEFAQIRGHPWAPVYRAPIYFGSVPNQALRLLNTRSEPR